MLRSVHSANAICEIGQRHPPRTTEPFNPLYLFRILPLHHASLVDSLAHPLSFASNKMKMAGACPGHNTHIVHLMASPIYLVV